MRRETEDRAIKLLRRGGYFSNASEEGLRELIKDGSRLIECDGGKEFYPFRSAKRSFGLLLTGSCFVKVNGVITDKKQAGFVFGSPAVTEKDYRPDFTLCAAQDCKALAIGGIYAEKLFEKEPGLREAFLEASRRGSGESGAKEEDASAAEQRLLEALSGGSFPAGADLSLLARKLGMSKAGFRAALESLNSRGLLGTERGRLIVRADIKEKR